MHVVERARQRLLAQVRRDGLYGAAAGARRNWAAVDTGCSWGEASTTDAPPPIPTASRVAANIVAHRDAWGQQGDKLQMPDDYLGHVRQRVTDVEARSAGLRKELGVALVERTPRKVLLTEIGREIAQRARDVLREIYRPLFLHRVVHPIVGTPGQ